MRRFWLASTAIPVFALAVASLVSLPKKLIYNASVSAPIGLYWLDNRPIERTIMCSCGCQNGSVNSLLNADICRRTCRF